MSIRVDSVLSSHACSSEILARPGKFSNPELPANTSVNKKAKSSTSKIAARTTAGLVIIAAALAGLTRGNVLKKLAPDSLKNAGIMKKIGHYLATAGDYISVYTYDKIIALVKKK